MNNGIYLLILIFLFGAIETFIYAWYLLEINKRKAISSSLVLFFQMFLYLIVIDRIIKSANTFYLIGVYCVGCCIGNYLKVKLEGVKIVVRKKQGRRKNAKKTVQKLHKVN